jgi:hypothetical protein
MVKDFCASLLLSLFKADAGSASRSREKDKRTFEALNIPEEIGSERLQKWESQFNP